MWEHLPSLNALRVFEAAGRHQSFKQAAAELHVTTSAVSRQVQALEEELGLRLFHRRHRGLELTETGAAYLREVTEALRRLDRASQALRPSGERRALRMSVLASFAGHWLVPRLPEFEARHPGIDVQLEATTRYADFASEQVDLAIRFGTGPWEGLHADPLLPLEFFPVCRPELASGDPPLRELADLAQHTWLDEVHVPRAWRLWLEAGGRPELEPQRRLTYDHAQLLLDAAVAGLGVGLGTNLLTDSYLADGRLVAPFAQRVPSPFTYHLVMRPDERDAPHVRAFRGWILDEMARWQARTA